MESQELIGVVAAPPINAMPMKEIVTEIRIVQEILFVEQTIVRQLDYLEAAGLGVLIAASLLVCFSYIPIKELL